MDEMVCHHGESSRIHTFHNCFAYPQVPAAQLMSRQMMTWRHTRHEPNRPEPFDSLGFFSGKITYTAILSLV